MKHLFSLFFFVSLTGVLYAQTNTGYNGSYTLNKEKTEFGSAPESTLPTAYKLVKDGDKLIITTTISDGTSYTDNLIFGGSETSTVLASGLTRKATLTWNSDKSAFTINSNSLTGDGKGSKITAIWSLTNGGKTLVVDRNVEQANGLKYDIKGFYERQ